MNIKFLPNVMTLANISCGFLSILFSINGQSVLAAWLIIIAVVFDIMDGYIARLYKITSDFGKELDSFSDLVSFGVAVSVLLYTIADLFFGLVLIVLLTYLFCGSFRLARFNTSPIIREDSSFEGLPITAAGGTIASVFLVLEKINPLLNSYFLPALMLALAFLMVSRVGYPAFKKQQMSKSKYLIGSAAALVFLVLSPALTICLFLLIYIIFSPLKLKSKEE